MESLSVEDSEAFYAMANVYENDADVDAASGIFMTNCFDMTDSIFGEACAMYLALARLNHSCTPNVQQTHNAETTEEVLYAARDIAKGEELNDCYIDLRQTRAARRAALLEHYRFLCECSACSGISATNETGSNTMNAGSSSSNSSNSSSSGIGEGVTAEDAASIAKRIADDDKVRVRVAQYSDIVIDLVAEGEHQTALDMSLQVTRLMEDPRYTGWTARYLAEAHMTVYQIALELRLKPLAREYLEKAHKMNVKLLGKDSAESRKTAKLLGPAS